MLRGRKPKPTELKRLAGNPGKRRLPPAKPKGRLVVPACPSHLAGVARLKWHSLSRELARSGLLARTDIDALAAYCTVWARWLDAKAKLDKFGDILKNPGGFPMMSPYLLIVNKCLEQMLRLGTEFGLTPSSRSRVAAPPQEDPQGVENFLFGKSVGAHHGVSKPVQAARTGI